MNCLEPSVALFDAVVVKALGLVVSFYHPLRGIEKMLYANGELVGFGPKVFKVALGKKRHRVKIVNRD